MKTTILTVTEYTNYSNHKVINYKADGVSHNPYGPAYIIYYENGQIQSEHYYLNGKYHREDGPAFISYYRDGKIAFEHYFLNDKYHREDGPAVISYYNYNRSGQIASENYFLNGKRISKKAFNQRVINKNNSCQDKVVEIESYYLKR